MASHETTLVFEFDDARRASVVAAGVRGEVGEIAGDRMGTRVEREGSVLEIRIEASDLVALRAGISTWCSFVDVASEVAAIGASEN
jgi:KEOPS complex subunit Pcc1